MAGLPIDFGTGFPGDFANTTFPNMDMGSEIIDYGEFLNDSEGLTMDFPVWGEGDLGTEA
jgi:hypothetical protein